MSKIVPVEYQKDDLAAQWATLRGVPGCPSVTYSRWSLAFSRCCQWTYNRETVDWKSRLIGWNSLVREPTTPQLKASIQTTATFIGTNGRGCQRAAARYSLRG
jgi:hypothetical protein